MSKTKKIKSMPSGLKPKEKYVWLRDNRYCPLCYEKHETDYYYVYCELCRKHRNVKKYMSRYFSRKIESGMI